MKRKLVYFVLGMVFAIFVLLLVFFLKSYVSSFKPAISSNILYLTEPVFYFSGKVERVENDSIILNRHIEKSLIPPFMLNAPVKFKALEPKTISYKIDIDKDTRIIRTKNSPDSTSLFPLLSSGTQPEIEIMQISDIKPGVMLTASTISDLRSLTKNEFKAYIIQLPSQKNHITGTVSKFSNNLIVLQAITFSPNAQPDIYNITITPETKIIQINNGKSISVPLDTIKIGGIINVSIKEDANKTKNVTALQIEPSITVPISPSITLAPNAK